MQQKTLDGIARFLYTQNPFYLVSAGLILYGLKNAFRAGGEMLPQSAWLLVASLCGYSLLLAGTAFLVVRWGKVWQDARSLFVILVLMFIALSVSFDEICNQFPTTAMTVLPWGWLFSVLVTEALLRSLSLKFPTAYRLPFYLVLILFFLFPIWVSPAISQLSPAAVAMRIYMFPVFCGAAFLSLVPAIRRGARLVADNGTPWKWPWYPWTLFVFLGLAVCVRSYALTLSFQPALGLQSSFGLYYLTPFLLAVLVLLLEIGVVERVRFLRWCVMAAPPLLILSAAPWGTGEPYQLFWSQLVSGIGSPVWLATLGGALFYAYALHRGLGWAEVGVGGTLLAASMIDPTAVGGDLFVAPQWWWLAAMGVWQLERALARPHSARWFVSANCLGLAILFVGQPGWLSEHRAITAMHLGVGCALLVGHGFSDRCAIALRYGGFVFLITAGVLVTTFFGGALDWRLGYVMLTAGVSAYVCWQTRRPCWAAATVTNTVCLVMMSSTWLQTGLADAVGQEAMQPLIWGLRCFGVALAISALKAGLARELYRRLDLLNARQCRGRAWI